MLRLAGIVRVVTGHLQVRNRIYENVFDRAWVLKHMPDADLRRQRAAARSATIRTASVAALIVAVITGLAAMAVVQRNKANTIAGARDKALGKANRYAEDRDKALTRADAAIIELTKATSQKNAALLNATEQKTAAQKAAAIALAAQKAESSAKQQAQEREEETARLLYASDMGRIPGAFENNDIGLVSKLLEETRRSKSRGFEWGYWYRQTHLYEKVLTSLQKPISGIAATPDGRRLAICSSDFNGIQIIDAETGGNLDEIGRRNVAPPHDAMAMSPDGQSIAINALRSDLGRREILIEVHNLSNAKALTTISSWQRDLSTIVYSPDGRYIAASGVDPFCEIWEAKTGLPVSRFLFVPNPVPSQSNVAGLSHTDVATQVLFVSNDVIAIKVPGETLRCVNIHSPDTHTPAASNSEDDKTFGGHNEVVVGAGVLAISPDRRRIFARSDNSVGVWNSSSQRLMQKIAQGVVNATAFSSDGKCIVFCSQDGSLNVIDGADYTDITALKAHTRAVTCIAALPGSERIVTGGADGKLILWDLKNAVSDKVIRIPSAKMAAISSDPRTLVTFESGCLCCTDLNSGHVTPIFRSSGLPASQNSKPTVSGDGQRVAILDGGVAMVFDAKTGKPIATIKSSRLHPPLALSYNGQLLAALDRSDPQSIRLQIWDLKSTQVLRSFETSVAPSVAVFAPNDAAIAYGVDRDIVIGDLYDNKHSYRLTGRRGNIVCEAFSRDGTWLATGIDDHTVTLWNLSRQHKEITLDASKEDIIAVNFSHDSSRFGVVQKSGSATIYESATGQPVMKIDPTLSNQLITNIAFADEDRALVTVGSQTQNGFDGPDVFKLPTVLLWRSESASETLQRPASRLLSGPEAVNIQEVLTYSDGYKYLQQHKLRDAARVLNAMAKCGWLYDQEIGLWAQLNYWLGKPPDQEAALHELDDLARLHGKIGDAIYDRLLRTFPVTPRDLQTTLAAAQANLRNNPDDRDTKLTCGALLFRTGRLVEAEAHLKSLVQSKDSNFTPQANAYLALLLRQTGRSSEADRQFKVCTDSMAADPSAAQSADWYARVELAILLREAGIHVEP